MRKLCRANCGGSLNIQTVPPTPAPPLLRFSCQAVAKLLFAKEVINTDDLIGVLGERPFGGASSYEDLVAEIDDRTLGVVMALLLSIPEPRL